MRSDIEHLNITIHRCPFESEVPTIFKLLPRLIAERCLWLEELMIGYKSRVFNQMKLAEIAWVIAAIMCDAWVLVQVFLQNCQTIWQHKTVLDLHSSYQNFLTMVVPALQTSPYMVEDGWKILVTRL